VVEAAAAAEVITPVAVGVVAEGAEARTAAAEAAVVAAAVRIAVATARTRCVVVTAKVESQRFVVLTADREMQVLRLASPSQNDNRLLVLRMTKYF
jgi:hypothetical protein